MNLQEFREKHPAYKDVPDDKLAQGLHRKYYSSMPFEEFAQKIGMQQPAQRSTGDGLVRQIGLTARHAAEGAAGLVGIVADPLGATLDAVIPKSRSVADVVAERPSGPRYVPLQQSVSGLLDKVGLPQPETATERVVGGASRALVGQAGFVGAGQKLAHVGGQAVRAVGEKLAAHPGPQGTAAVSGTGAAETAREHGASPTTQAVVGLGAGMAVPMAGPARDAAFRGLVRGGETGRRTVEENIRRFNAAGTSPTVAQATESQVARGTEATLERLPGGGPVTAHAERQAKEIGQAVEAAAAKLAPASSAERAGMAVREGIKGEDGFVGAFRARSRELYDEVDKVVPKGTAVDLSQTRKALDMLTAPIEGAAATSKTLANPRLLEIAEAVKADLGDGGTLPYEAVKKLRSRIGELMTDSALVTDMPKAQLKQLWGALTGDIKTMAGKSASATAALTRANNYYQAGLKRLDMIDDVVNRNGGPEAIFKAATSGTREGATVLRSVMQSLPEDSQKSLAAAMVRRMGRANPSNQNELGEVFSAERFLTNWNTLSREARSTLFNRFGEAFRRDMDRIAEVTANIRAGSQVYRNPSGTTQAAVQAGAGTMAVLAFFTGRFVELAAMGGAVVATNVISRLTVNPKFVSWLAKTTRLPTSALSAQIQVLDNIAKRDRDSDIQRFATALSQAADTQATPPEQ